MTSATGSVTPTVVSQVLQHAPATDSIPQTLTVTPAQARLAGGKPVAMAMTGAGQAKVVTLAQGMTQVQALGKAGTGKVKQKLLGTD